MVRARIFQCLKSISKGFLNKKVYVLFVILFSDFTLSEQNISSDERKVKTAYLYHLTKFVDWPDAHINRVSDAINICVVSDAKFSEILTQLESKEAKGRPLRVVPITSSQKPPSCQIVFYQSGTLGNKAQLLQFSEQGTLTVGENESFIRSGGMVSLVVRKNSVRLYVNLALIKKAGVLISANLLEISTIIE